MKSLVSIVQLKRGKGGNFLYYTGMTGSCTFKLSHAENKLKLVYKVFFIFKFLSS